MCKELPHQEGGNIQEEMAMDDDHRMPYRDQRPPERGRYPNQGGRPLTKEDTQIEDSLEEGTP